MEKRYYYSYILALIVYLFIALLLFRWVYNSSPADRHFSIKQSLQKDTVKIGLSMNSLLEDRWQRDRDIFITTAKELGAEVFVQVAFNDPKQQISQIRYLLSKNIDVLVIIPSDKNILAPIIKEVRSRGIRVISYESLIESESIDLYVGFDNFEAGRLQAQAMLKSVPRGDYILLNGPINDNTALMNKKGQLEVLEPYISKGDIKIIYQESIPFLDPKYAVRFINNAIIQYKDIDAIIAPNDICAGEIIKFLSDKLTAHNIKIIGSDADLLACRRIYQGMQQGTIYKPIEKLARTAAEYAVELANGDNIDVQDKISLGQVNIPSIILPVEYVDKNNLIEVIDTKNKFHTKEDILTR
jgi:D-xylose transport system substrate-binding protein